MKRHKSGKLLQWQTWWCITGPRLPDREYRFTDRIILAPIPPEDFERLKAHRAPNLNLTPSLDSFVIAYPPRDEVQSRHRLQIDVEAADEEEACTLAQQTADKFLLSLSLAVPGRRYHAEMRKMRRAGENEEATAWSQSAQVAMFNEPDLLYAADIDAARALFTVTDRDTTAENAYIHLLTAWQLQSTAGTKPLQRSILQHFVLCVEAVVNGVMTSVRKERGDAIRQEERKFANEFAESLPRRADKPEAIRNASTQLRTISLTNMLPAIETVSSLLNVPSDMRDHAKDLYRFRSSNLSHPGRENPDGFKRWLGRGPTVADFCLADIVARSFLLNYCTRMWHGT
jgi:hypothetical protein